MLLKNPELLNQGYIQTTFILPEDLKNLVAEEKWNEVDQYFQLITKKDGDLFLFLQNHHEFNSIEFIISIRDAQNEWEEDGIWHDDGSRIMAFSLSLTLNQDAIQGGILGMRKKGEDSFASILTPPFGQMIIFLTGEYGFEHKIHQVTAGKRVIIAGWCS